MICDFSSVDDLILDFIIYMLLFGGQFFEHYAKYIAHSAHHFKKIFA